MSGSPYMLPNLPLQQQPVENAGSMQAMYASPPSSYSRAIITMPQQPQSMNPYVILPNNAPASPGSSANVSYSNSTTVRSALLNDGKGGAGQPSSPEHTGMNANESMYGYGMALQVRNAALEREVKELQGCVQRLQRQRAADAARWEAYHREQQNRLGAMSLLLHQERQASMQVFQTRADGLVWPGCDSGNASHSLSHARDVSPAQISPVPSQIPGTDTLTGFDLTTSNTSMAAAAAAAAATASTGAGRGYQFAPILLGPSAPPALHETVRVFPPPQRQQARAVSSLSREEGSGEDTTNTPASRSLSFSGRGGGNSQFLANNATTLPNGDPIPPVLKTLYGPASRLLTMPLSTSAEFYEFYITLRQVEQRTGFLTAAVRTALMQSCPLEELEPPKDGYWGFIQPDAGQWRLERYYFVHKCLRFLPKLTKISITQCKYFPLRVNAKRELDDGWFASLEEASVLGTWWKAEEIEAVCAAFERRKAGQLRLLRLSKSYGTKDKDLEEMNGACGGKLEFV